MRAARMIKVLPSMFTLANLLCGFAAIFYASRLGGSAGPRDSAATEVLGHFTVLTVAASLIFLGMVFDALDGRIARMTRNTSELGEQLDSMSDMVTFGVAPAFLIIQLVGIGTAFFGPSPGDTLFDRAVLVVAAVYVACCALRLARFNVEIDLPEESDHSSFKGLPSPAAAGTVASLVILHQHLLTGQSAAAWYTALGLVAVTLMAALAMVSTLRYVHILNRYLRGRAPFEYLVVAVILILAFSIVPELSLAVGCVFYALTAPVAAILRRLAGIPAPLPAPAAAPAEAAPTSAPAVPPTQSDDRPPLRIRHQ